MCNLQATIPLSTQTPCLKYELQSFLGLNRNRLPNTAIAFALNGSLLERADVELLSSHKPIHHSTQQDKRHKHNRIIHGLPGNRSGGGEEEDNRNKHGPDHSPQVDGSGEFAHVPWTRLEAIPEEFAHDGDDVGPVESDGGDVEDTLDSGVATETDQIDSNAPEDREPHGIQGSTGLGIHFAPDT